jgi:hypothetical protein
MSVLFIVFAPRKPLSGVRWNYQQNEDGTAVRFLTLKNGRETTPDLLNTDAQARAGGLGNALDWARCLHSDYPPHFDVPEAQEIYSTLHNVVMHVKEGGKYGKMGARVCLEGIIEDCQEWMSRLKDEEVAT